MNLRSIIRQQAEFDKMTLWGVPVLSQLSRKEWTTKVKTVLLT